MEKKTFTAASRDDPKSKYGRLCSMKNYKTNSARSKNPKRFHKAKTHSGKAEKNTQIELVGDVDLIQVHTAQREITSSPYSGDLLEIFLAAAASLLLLQNDGVPVWILAVGSPSNDKTQTVLGISHAPEVYTLDTLTEHSFITGFVNKDGSAPSDLLAELDCKCLLIKDLTTLFSMKDDVIKRVLGDLQSIYDGFFSRFTGTRGKVGYSTRLSLLGCVTPLALYRHHRYIAEMGSRLLFYRVPSLSSEEREKGLVIVWESKGRKEKVTEYQKLASSYLHKLLKSSPPEIEATADQKEQINRLAELLCRGRGVIRSAKQEFTNEDDKEISYYAIEETQIEEPFRATLQLKTLAQSLAFVHGRTQITDHEMEHLRRVVLSTMPVNRASVLELFRYPSKLTEEGMLTTNLCKDGIGMSYGRAKQLLTELVHLKILEIVKIEDEDEDDEEEEDKYTIKKYRPREEFRDLISKPVEPLDHISDLNSKNLPTGTAEGLTQNTPQGGGNRSREVVGDYIKHYGSKTFYIYNK